MVAVRPIFLNGKGCTVFFRLVLCAVAGLAGQQGAEREATPQQAVASFERFFTLVSRGEVAIHMETWLDATNAAAGDPKALQRYRAWDKNRDGALTREEGAAGLRTDLVAQVEEQMTADANGDAALDRTEFSLAVPDTQAAKDSAGLTARQLTMFRSADRDQNQRITRDEAVASQAYRLSHGYRGRFAAYLARGCDSNHDGRYDLTEFAHVYGVVPGAGISPELRSAYAGKATNPEPLDRYAMMMRIIHWPLSQIDELAARLAKVDASPTRSTAGTDATLLKLFDLLDTGHQMRVPLNRFFDALNFQQAEARQVKRLRELDVNGDGEVTREEARTALRNQIKTQVDRTMNTDADGNGVVSLEEYALSFPDVKEKPGADGVTAAQRRGFQLYDADADGKVTREEARKIVEQGYESFFWPHWMALRAHALDQDRDGFLDATESAGLLAQLTKVETTKAARAVEAMADRLALKQLPHLFQRVSPADRPKVEETLGRLAPANSTN
jgi:Ca2+-binding EF-hand superfamily protein